MRIEVGEKLPTEPIHEITRNFTKQSMLRATSCVFVDRFASAAQEEARKKLLPPVDPVRLARRRVESETFKPRNRRIPK